MRMKKRIVSVLLSLMLILTLVPLIASAAGAISFTVGNVTQELSAGDEVTVPINVTSNPGYILGGVTLGWDSEALELKNVIYNAELAPKGQSGPITNSGTYIIDFGSDAAMEDFTGTGTFFTLTFEITDRATAGDYAITLNDSPGGFTNNALTTVSATYTPGTVTLTGVDTIPVDPVTDDTVSGSDTDAGNSPDSDSSESENGNKADGDSEGKNGSKENSSPSVNSVALADVEHGSVTAAPISTPGGVEIILTPKADQGYEVDAVKVTDADGREVPVTQNSGGTYSFTMPEGRVTITPSFRPAGSDMPVNFPPSYDCPSAPYQDVDVSLWYHKFIDYVIEKGLMNGTSSSTFEPDATTTRNMIVTILYRLEGGPTVTGDSGFADVAEGMWYTDAIKWAAVNGVVNGYDSETFGPDDPITREQFAAILYRYAEFKGIDVSTGEDTDNLSYEDKLDISDWAVKAIQWACNTELILGMDDGTLLPQDNATRAQAAAILMRFCENLKQ